MLSLFFFLLLNLKIKEGGGGCKRWLVGLDVQNSSVADGYSQPLWSCFSSNVSTQLVQIRDLSANGEPQYWTVFCAFNPANFHSQNLVLPIRIATIILDYHATIMHHLVSMPQAFRLSLIKRWTWDFECAHQTWCMLYTWKQDDGHW